MYWLLVYKYLNLLYKLASADLTYSYTALYFFPSKKYKINREKQESVESFIAALMLENLFPTCVGVYKHILSYIHNLGKCRKRKSKGQKLNENAITNIVFSCLISQYLILHQKLYTHVTIYFFHIVNT